MSALNIIVDAGVQASIETAGGLKLKGLSKLTIQQKNQIINFARKHKHEILETLTKHSAPGDCNSCPAAGFWDNIGPGKFCFHTAYFLGKPGKPVHCNSAQHDCPAKYTHRGNTHNG